MRVSNIYIKNRLLKRLNYVGKEGLEPYRFSAGFPFFRTQLLKNMGEPFQVPHVSPQGLTYALHSLCSFVGKEGLEPSHLAIHDFESCASTIPPLAQ